MLKFFKETEEDCPLSIFIFIAIMMLIFMFGVQFGIDRGRDLAAREAAARVQGSGVGVQGSETPNSELTTPNSSPVPVTIYAYAPVRRCTDKTPHTTASQQHVRPGIIAVSRDIEADLGLRFGDLVQIEGLGTFDFQDRMNARHVRSVDVFMPSVRECKAFGKKAGVLVVASRGRVSGVGDREVALNNRVQGSGLKNGLMINNVGCAVRTVSERGK